MVMALNHEIFVIDTTDRTIAANPMKDGAVHAVTHAIERSRMTVRNSLSVGQLTLIWRPPVADGAIQ
jgi:hypothetical protein